MDQILWVNYKAYHSTLNTNLLVIVLSLNSVVPTSSIIGSCLFLYLRKREQVITFL